MAVHDPTVSPRRVPHQLEELLTDVPVRFTLTSPRSLEMCRRHGILPEELYPRTLQSFVENKHEMPEMVQRRFEHFNTRRLEKLRFLIEERRHWMDQPAAVGTPGAHAPVHAHAGFVSPDAAGGSGLRSYPSQRSASPGGSTAAYGASVEAVRLEQKIQREEERQARLAEKRRADEERAEQQRQKIAWEDDRANATIAAIEERQAEQAQRMAAHRNARRAQVLDTHKAISGLTLKKKELLSQRDTDRESYLEEKRSMEEQTRVRQREAKAQRAAEIKERRAEMERARAQSLQEKINDKQARTASFEDMQAAQQYQRAVVVSERQRLADQKVDAVRREVEERVRQQQGHLHEQDARLQAQHTSPNRVRTEQAAAAAHRRQEALERRKALDQMQRAQAVAKVEGKEARKVEAAELARQKQIWNANERRLRQMDAQEAVERQRRKAAYENEMKQRALHDKMQRLTDMEEARWAEVQDKRHRLQQLRDSGTPRRAGATGSPRVMRRTHSAGGSVRGR